MLQYSAEKQGTFLFIWNKKLSKRRVSAEIVFDMDIEKICL